MMQREVLKIQGNPLRKAAFERDRAVCARCDADCEKVKRVYWRILDEDAQWHYGNLVRYNDKVFWEADHIIERADGGRDEIDNIQTLCRPCHLEKTTESKRQRALRRMERVSAETQLRRDLEERRARASEEYYDAYQDRLLGVLEHVIAYIDHRAEVNGGYWPKTLEPIESDYAYDPWIAH